MQTSLMVHLVVELLFEYGRAHAFSFNDQTIWPLWFQDVLLELWDITQVTELLVFILPGNQLRYIERYSFWLQSILWVNVNFINVELYCLSIGKCIEKSNQITRINLQLIEERNCNTSYILIDLFSCVIKLSILKLSSDLFIKFMQERRFHKE